MKNSIIIQGYSKQDLLSFGALPKSSLGEVIKDNLKRGGMIIKDIAKSYDELPPYTKYRAKKLRNDCIKDEFKKHVQLDFDDESDRDLFILKVDGKELIKV
ncbi:hypothetical protein [Methanosarcina sp.]|uniref:hypothetical protein n=1 Tax=Methanosarcina sp. TaxID=2213 RepID=UPI003BB681C8